MQRPGPTSTLLALLAHVGPAVAYEGAALPLPGWWVGFPMLLSAIAAVFLLRNAAGRRRLALTVVGLFVLVPTAMLLVTAGGGASLIGAAIIAFSPWLLFLVLAIGVLRTEDPDPGGAVQAQQDPSSNRVEAARASSCTDPGDFPVTRPFDRI